MEPATLLRSEAAVATTLPRRYLVQLCRHFQHKLPVDLIEEPMAQGRIEFPFGACRLSMGPGTLHLVVEAADGEALTRMQDVIARHLLRFAFRDELTVDWVQA